MSWHLPEWVHPKVRHFYRDVREPPAPRRPRLGMSELEAQQAVRPPRRLIVGSRRTGDFWDRRIGERLAEKRFIEMPRKH